MCPGQSVSTQRTMRSALVLLLNVALASSSDFRDFGLGNNLFAVSLYKEISKTARGNFLASPFSAVTSLALAQSGAKGQTGQEIRSGLKIPNSKAKVEAAIRVLYPFLGSSQDYALYVANKIYVKPNFPVRDEFRLTAVNVHRGDVENVDFLQRNQAAATMNGWVAGQTGNRIYDLIDPNILTDRTRAVLINALYFQANWTSPFEAHMTRKQNFYRTAADVVQVDMMRDPHTHTNYYRESPQLDAKFLEMPFEGGDASMTIVLPNDKEGLAALESRISLVLSEPSGSREVVSVAVPKFRIEAKLDLRGILRNLGIRKAFKDNEADFSGISGNKGDLAISRVIQRTYVDVNEEGVEAATATFIDYVIPLSGHVPTFPVKEFIVDRPFIFFIKVKGLIIFVGRVYDPKY